MTARTDATAASAISAINGDRVVETYDLLRHGYYGTGGYEDGTYVVKHKREKDDNYKNRQKVAYYLNYVAPVVNSHVDPVFRAGAARDWSTDARFEKFYYDVDLNGYDLARFMKRAGLEAKLFGVTFIVLDNFAEQPATVGDVIESRILPYAYTVTPDRVTKYKTDRFGRLAEISYKEPADQDAIDPTDWTSKKTNIRTWTKTGWSVTDEDGKVVNGGDHNLGELPVVPYLSRPMQAHQYKPASEFLSVAKTNYHIYQLCSWLSEILQNQAFSILTYPTSDTKNPGSLQIGVNNALAYDGEKMKNPPEFIAPPSDPATMLQSQIDRLIQEIYRMAVLSFATGTKEAASGVSKAYDFEATNKVLADFALNSQDAEKRIVDLFNLWTGAKVTYTCDYPDDFGLVDVEAELKNAGLVLDMNVQSSTLLLEVVKKIINAYLPDLDQKIYDQIIAEVEEKGIDALMSATKYIDENLDPNKKKEDPGGGEDE